MENKKKPTGPSLARRKQGPNVNSQSPHEVRRSIIERFISRWKKEVGNNIWPAFRLIMPEKDRERPMYGLKEKIIGKLLLRIVKIDKNSDDGFNLLNWKLPGQKSSRSTAGDFAGRCYEVLSKRSMRTSVGNMNIEEVNERLDRLSVASKEDQQLPIMEEFCNRMNAEEMMWLIRVVLRQMKVGATEKTILDIWHPDADTLFSISSNLRRVCWELYDPKVRLEGEETDINLMDCFQPQLAQFQLPSNEKMILKMKPTEEDSEFWIEKKLDGERMQLHMMEDKGISGGMRFAFWSRKAKDYTYLYGESFEDDNSALTRHLKNAFHEGVRNIILDGEMITWNVDADHIVGFGSLKTAALAQQKNPYAGGDRPLYKVFDILYLNDKPLTRYTLRDRRNALQSAIQSVQRRLEIHEYTSAYSVSEIDPALKNIVTDGSEGLVLKSPRSAYHLNERSDDWFKVKPEYMTEYSEPFDCAIVGGYYGSGKRGGNLSSFLCGLRVTQNLIDSGADPLKFWSFFKVGGGFSAADYANIRHKTEGKWHDWDRKNPPIKYVELGGGDRQFECPDVWIRADESVVISVKGASMHNTEQFKTFYTLRFPRFKFIRHDRDWKSAMSVQDGWNAMHNMKEREEKDKATFEERRHKKTRTSKKEIVVAGAPEKGEEVKFEAPSTELAILFSGLTLCILTESLSPKRSKVQIEAWAKGYGAKITQSYTAEKNVLCIADRNVIKVAALQKQGTRSILRPAWLYDCVSQAERDIVIGRSPLLLPYEPRHVLFVAQKDQAMISSGADEWGDGYARDIASLDDIKSLLNGMPDNFEDVFDADNFGVELAERGFDLGEMPGWIFKGLIVYFDRNQEDPEDREDVGGNSTVAQVAEPTNLGLAANLVTFAGGRITHDLQDTALTHVVLASKDRRRERALREKLKR